MINAIIFDLDGTLVQTEKLKALSYARAAVELVPSLSEEQVLEAFKDVVGLSRRELAEKLMQRFKLTEAAEARMAEFSVDVPWQAFVQIRLGFYHNLLQDPQTILKNQWPNNVALLRQARQSCQKVGLATMSYCPQVRKVLKILKLEDQFDFVASRDDVEHGKPYPEIYLLVAHELGFPPEECLVIEDSAVGVQAAINAGMACIAVATPFTKDALYQKKILPKKWIVDEPDKLFDVVDKMLAAHA